MSLTAICWIITIIFCGAFLYISYKVQDNAQENFAQYAIAGGTMPLWLIMWTDFATIMGAGNFIGHATQGFKIGFMDIPFVFGEQGSKIIFALIFAGFAGRFTYITLSEMMEDLLHRDKITRILVGLLTCSIMVAWVGGQAMGLGQIFHVFTGADPVPVIILFNVVFIIYTVLGGIYSVVYTDVLQGIMVVLFGIIFYAYALAPIHYSIAELQQKLVAVGAPELATMKFPLVKVLTQFITGCFGILAAQVYWQRCFAAKDQNTARNAMLISGIFAVIAVSLTAIVGMVTKTLNPTLDPNQAMPWLMLHSVPTFVIAIVFALILAAAMSSADSNLNSAAVIIVNDIVKEVNPKLSEKQLVKYAQIITCIVGIFSAIAGITNSSIIGLFSKAYTMAGGGIVPVMLVGLLWKKDYTKAFTMGTRNSRLSAWGARLGIIIGAIVSLSKMGILWGVAISAVVAIIVSLIAPDVKEPMAPDAKAA